MIINTTVLSIVFLPILALITLKSSIQQKINGDGRK